VRKILGYSQEEAQADLDGWRERVRSSAAVAESGGRLRRPVDGLVLLRTFNTRAPEPDGLVSFAELWDKTLPPEHIIDTTDARGRCKRFAWCACGFVTPLVPACPVACVSVLWLDDGELDYAGPCSRFFLQAGLSVRVKRFEAPA
jgi:hypothetical protein